MSLLRHAVGQLYKSPGFSLISILLLTVGIGATTAIFTVVHSVLLRPIDYPSSDSLVVIRQTRLPEFPSLSVCPADYFDFRARSEHFENMYAARGDSLILTGHAAPMRVRTLRATADIFETLRLRPDQGRAFTPAEDKPGAAPVVVLLHDFWQSQLGGRSGVIGQTLTLNGRPTVIIGIMPPGFRTTPTSDMITPMAFTAVETVDRGMHHVSVVARLKEDASLAAANHQLAAVSDQLALEHPDDNTGWSAFALPLIDWHTRGVSPILYTLLGAVSLLLLICCVNVGNLVLVRATRRQHEFSLRAALGASRWQLTQMLLAESLVLGLVGGAAGLLFAHWGLDALVALGGEHIPRATEIELDQRVVVFTFGLSLLTGVIFGLAPMGRTHAAPLMASLKSGPRSTDDHPPHQRIRQGLIVAEIAFALILLNSVGLFGRNFMRLNQMHPGFTATGAWWIQLEVPPERYNVPAKQVAIAQAWASQLRELPGVSEAAFSSVMPFTGGNQVMRVQFPDRLDESAFDESAYYFAVSPAYFEAMQIPLIAGRDFGETDRADTPWVAIVSQSFVRRFFPGINPIGQRVNITNTDEPEWRMVVGVVADVKQFGLDQTESVQIYEPFAQMPGPRLSFVVRKATGTIGFGDEIRRAIYAIDSEQPVFAIRPVNDLIADSIARQRFALVIMGVFSGIALLLGSFGVYGVISYSVVNRTREIGVRMALGARPEQVLRIVLHRGLRLVGWGLLIGAPAAIGVGRLITSPLPVTGGFDFLVLGGVATLLAGVSMLACIVPARQATRVDPMIAIRTE